MKKPINKFLLKASLFIIPVLVFFEVLFRLGVAPIVTDSTLFDIKILKVQKQHIRKVDLLAMGSSVGLYELNSKLIVQNVDVSYYNFSSWGLQITDTRALLGSFVKKYQPKYVLLCSSSEDFVSRQNNTYFNYINTNDFIKDDLPELFYFKNYNSIHQLIRRKFNTYPLELDQWGAASLNVKPGNINKGRSAGQDIFPTKYTAGNYNALDSLAAFLKAQNVKFIFVQVPVNISRTDTDQSQQILSAHFVKCRSIVQSHGGTYLNYYNTTVFSDSLFTDQYHLQDAGAVILTKEIVKDLKGVVR